MSFKKVPSEPRYAVNEFGEVLNLRTRKLIHPSKDSRGNMRFTALPWYHSVSVHRLVAEVFIPNPDDKPYVIHKDGDNSNNNVNNLEWSSRRRYQERLYLEGGKNHNAGKIGSQPIRINETGEEFESITACARYLGVDKSAVRQQLNGQTKRCKGYTFSRVKKSCLPSGSITPFIIEEDGEV